MRVHNSTQTIQRAQEILDNSHEAHGDTGYLDGFEDAVQSFTPRPSSCLLGWKGVREIPLELYIVLRKKISTYRVTYKIQDGMKQLTIFSSKKILVLVALFALNFVAFQFETWARLASCANSNLLNRKHKQRHRRRKSRRSWQLNNSIGHKPLKTQSSADENPDDTDDVTMINIPVSSTSRRSQSHDRRESSRTFRINSGYGQSTGVITSFGALHIDDKARTDISDRREHNPIIGLRHDDKPSCRRLNQMSARSSTVDASNWITNRAGVPVYGQESMNTSHVNVVNSELQRIMENHPLGTACYQCSLYSPRYPVCDQPDVTYSYLDCDQRRQNHSNTSQSVGTSNRFPIKHESWFQSQESGLQSNVITPKQTRIPKTNLVYSGFGSDGELLMNHYHRHNHDHDQLEYHQPKDLLDRMMLSRAGSSARACSDRDPIDSSSDRINSLSDVPKSKLATRRSPFNTEKLSLVGAKKRLMFRKKGLTQLNVHRSEEVIPYHAKFLSRQTTVGSLSESVNKDSSTLQSMCQISPPGSSDFGFSFVESLGQGQIVSRQALVSPDLGDIQLSISDQRTVLEVEVIRARGLHLKAGSSSLPSPYVKVYLMRGKICVAKFKTEAVQSSLNPLYQRKFIFRGDHKGCVLQVIVWGNYSRKDKKNLMGVAQIRLDEIDISNLLVGWYKLFHMPSMDGLMLSSRALRCKLLSNQQIPYGDAEAIDRCYSQPT